MKNKAWLLSVFLCIHLLSKGQSEFQDGYIIKSPGDTLFGLIKNQNYYENSLTCIIMSKNDSSILFYGPKEIYGYRFSNGKYYISKEIEENGVKSRYFMEYLVNGRLNIYFKQSKKGFNQYYADRDTLPIIELVYKSRIANENGKYFVKESGKLYGTLKYYTSDCPQVWDDAFYIKEPTHGKLIKFAKKYNKIVCSDKACIIYEKNKSFKIEMEIYSAWALLKNKDIPLTSKKSFGFSLFFQKPEYSESLYLGVGLSYYEESPLIFSLTLLHSENPNGFSLIYGGGLTEFILPKIIAGWQYRTNHLSVRLYADDTFILAHRFRHILQANFGLFWTLKK